MLLIDANAILRYILQDNQDMANKVDEIIADNIVNIRYEIMAEVVYVLEKVYSVPRADIPKGIEIFINQPNVEIENKDVMMLALETYGEKKLDFVDCILSAFNAVEKIEVFTFDKKLNAIIKKDM